MSRQNHDADPQTKSRPRANTASFPSFTWRKPRSELSSPSAFPGTSASQHALSVESLIEALTPPAVPSLSHARALASVLSTHSPLPKRTALNPILASLCDAESPVSIQAAGYEILSSSLDNNESVSLETADRLSYVSLFRGSATSWGMELWEPRFKALRALTRFGSDIVGIEGAVICILIQWIEGVFEGLLKVETSLERPERAERERSIDVLVKFLISVLSRAETTARLSESMAANVTSFFASLVDRAIPLPLESTLHDRVSAILTDSPSASTIMPKQPSLGHRRNTSSISTSSMSVTTSPPALKPSFKHPAEIAIPIYLNYFSSQIKTLPPDHLSKIVPVLYRALAFCAAPLPRLTVLPRPSKKSTLEEQVSEIQNSLLSGPYSSTCILVLKRHLSPPNNSANGSVFADSLQMATMTSLGAHRTLRNFIRRGLSTRLARAYISREATTAYSHTGAPAHMEMEMDLMEKAWPKDDYTPLPGSIGNNTWDAGNLGKSLASSIGSWAEWDPSSSSDGGEKSKWEKAQQGKEKVLEEAAGILKDILQELDERDDESVDLDEEEAEVVGDALRNLAGFVLHVRCEDRSPFIVPLSQPTEAPTPLLRIVTSLLARDYSLSLKPILSQILITLAEHLSDSDTAKLPVMMMEQHELSPTSPAWISNWDRLFMNPLLISNKRPLTQEAVMNALGVVYDSVRDMKLYREPLADMVLQFCAKALPLGSTEGGLAIWKLLADEIVLRATERPESVDTIESVNNYIDLLVAIALNHSSPEISEDDAKLVSTETDSFSPGYAHSSSGASSSAVSPPLAKVQSDISPSKEKDKDSAFPSVMSTILSSFTASSGSASRGQSMSYHLENESREPVAGYSHSEDQLYRPVSSVSALIAVFCELAFTPFSIDAHSSLLAIRIFKLLLKILSKGRSDRARLAILQFLTRIRADRDHKLYMVGPEYDVDGLISTLAALINRVADIPFSETHEEEMTEDHAEFRKDRMRTPQERNGRQASRARAVHSSQSIGSRSRSRATTHGIPSPPLKLRDPWWKIPEIYPFSNTFVDSLSEGLISYDPKGLRGDFLLPLSEYLNHLIDILKKERNWELISYILCHLPVQLSNKHLFCGPRSKAAIKQLLSELCTGILNNVFGSQVDPWPSGLKARDAQGLAYHTLSVLVSYRQCFEVQQRHLLVEVFQAGLNLQASTIKCCLHALSLCAFEFPFSMTKCLSRILEKLSQIMSNPDMAVHILGFLSIIASLPSLYANFTEGDFKMVFGVALQYLQHYNRLNASPTVSWALSQHVRVLSYYVVYVWFLAIKLPDRPAHIQYIARQLILANEGNDQLDGPTEVCFDWLARYTYASADPRPATSKFGEIIMSPARESRSSTETVLAEKSWIIGNSVATVRVLTRLGWVEILSRRPSGYSKFLCRVENVPLVGPGDVSPDRISIPAGLLLERNDPSVPPPEGPIRDTDTQYNEILHMLMPSFSEGTESEPPIPNPITGYVWSGTAPSQRRKDVLVDPSFILLQLSPYSESPSTTNVKRVNESANIAKFIASLDRIPVIDTHKVGIMYVAPGQILESQILGNSYGSPAYTRFLEGIGRLINLHGQVDVYAGGLDPDEDGEYAYAWWDDIGQILYHTATMMPNSPDDPHLNNKKRHIGNDYVRIVWNDSGRPYRFDTLNTQFQFVNIVIEPHSLGTISAFSNNLHENEYFKVTVQRAPGMTEFAPVGHFKLISAENLPLLVRQLSLLADWFASIFSNTRNDTARVEIKTNWQMRLEAIRRFQSQYNEDRNGDIVDQDFRDFSTLF
ncbi:hypothetical protein BDQ17DRAFT_1541218 [Cyathus striatus]|nr:hypothetical protein BDQ17DRAFT_1541218 [Cyathus striatus]